MSLDVAKKVLDDDGFPQFLARTIAQSKSDPDSARMTDLYTQALSAQLDQIPGARLKGVGCGLSLCVGALVTNGDQSAALRSLDLLMPVDSETPSYSMFEVSKGDAVEQERRFIFSLDPEINGFQSAARP